MLDIHYQIAGMWDIELLPYLPKKFHLHVRKKSKNELFEIDYQSVLNKIVDLFHNCEEIIVATDAAREGELIFRYIYEYAKTKTPFKRVWLQSLKYEAVKDAFANLKDGNLYDNLYYSGKARRVADWLVGINATQAFSLSLTGDIKGKIISIGRVQTPTLSFICERYLSIKKFTKKKYYELEINLGTKNGYTFKAKSLKHYGSDKDIQALVNSIGKKFVCHNIENRKNIIEAPKLYDLTSLQEDANEAFGYSAKKTLRILQNVYEKGIISYPRTDSNYLPSDYKNIILDSIKKFREDIHPKFYKYIDQIIKKPEKLQEKIFDDTKVSDHYAIIIDRLNYDISELSESEINILNLIKERMTQAALPDRIDSFKNYFFSINEELIFQLSELVDRKTDLDIDFGIKFNEEINKIKVGDIFELKAYTATHLETKPPSHYTEGKLLRKMKNAGDFGLGTASTRSEIIENILSKNYAFRQDKYIIPTELGLLLHKHLGDYDISKPSLTTEWEKKLFLIEKGLYSYVNFKQEIEEYTKNITSKMFEIGSKFVFSIDSNIYCPSCNEGVIIENNDNYNCEKCLFKFPKTIKSLLIPKNEIRRLFKYKTTKIIYGFISKNGKKFSARLFFDKNLNLKWSFDS